jgi:hypothetical protein
VEQHSSNLDSFYPGHPKHRYPLETTMAVCQTSRGSGTTEHGYARMIQCGVNQFSTCRSAWKPADANAVRDDHFYAKWIHRLGFGLNIFVAYGYLTSADFDPISSDSTINTKEDHSISYIFNLPTSFIVLRDSNFSMWSY